MTTLEIKHLRKVFSLRGRRKLLAVDDVSFTLESGRTVALVGESGSGKSTIARVLARLTRATAGEIVLDGEEVGHRRSETARYRTQVQMVFQDPFGSLNPAHTIRYHLRRPLAIHDRVAAGRKPEDEVVNLLERVNLNPARALVDRFPYELSGGQRQRVAIARALAPGPRVLLADEPVSMLDVSVRLEILELLDRLKSENDLAVLYITHDLATARYFATTILVMYRGQVVESGPADDVIVRPAHPYTQLLALSAPDPEAAHGEVEATTTDVRPGIPAVTSPDQVNQRGKAVPQDGSDPGCKFRDRCPFAIELCETKPPVVTIREGHQARCWMYDDEQGGRFAA